MNRPPVGRPGTQRARRDAPLRQDWGLSFRGGRRPPWAKGSVFPLSALAPRGRETNEILRSAQDDRDTDSHVVAALLLRMTARQKPQKSAVAIDFSVSLSIIRETVQPICFLCIFPNAVSSVAQYFSEKAICPQAKSAKNEKPLRRFVFFPKKKKKNRKWW